MVGRAFLDKGMHQQICTMVLKALAGKVKGFEEFQNLLHSKGGHMIENIKYALRAFAMGFTPALLALTPKSLYCTYHTPF